MLLVAFVAAAGVAAVVLELRSSDDRGGRLYGADSPLNTKIPADAQIDPRSPAMVEQLVAEANENGWPVAVKMWTNAIYHAPPSTPRRSVSVEGLGGRRVRVPIPSHAQVPPDADGGLVVIDESEGCEYDFGRAHKHADGTWAAAIFNALALDGRGIYPYGQAPSASGFANAAGTILEDELRDGRIEHALAFTMQHTKAGGPVPPATASDGWSTVRGAIPEGARVQLDPDLDLDAHALEPWQKVVARALQEYGMYLVDTGGAFALRAQHGLSTSGSYPWGDVTYAYMPRALVPHLRVLELGRQFEPVHRFVSTRCTTLR